MEKAVRPLILSFFFLSGGCGLIYEITWLRLLNLQAGSTLLAITTVLTAFMGGLALGSYLWGRYIDGRPSTIRDPLLVYGTLEILIGLYGLLLPSLIHQMEPLFRWAYQVLHDFPYIFHLLRFTICILLLLPPTTLMGGTFPVLCRYFVKGQDRLGWELGRLYGLNLWGGVMGTTAAGFALLPSLGVTLTHLIAALTNLFLGIAALVLREQKLGSREQRTEDWRLEKEGREQGKKGREQRSWQTKKASISFHPRLILLTAGLSGLTAMVYQIGWTRALNLSIGSSVYAFSLVLTAFLSGLALGSIVLSKLIDRVKDQTLLLGVTEGLLALSALMVIPLLGHLPLWVIPGVLSRFGHFGSILFWELTLVALIILVPTTLMGFLLPLMGKIYVRNLQSLGRSVGRIYAANTLGAILGILASGFLLIPWLGLQRSLWVGITINLALGLLFLFNSSLSRPWKSAAALGISLLVLVPSQILPSWDKIVLTSGPFLYAEEYQNRPDVKGALKERTDEILYYREGSVGTISVHQLMEGTLTLKIDGKTDASTGPDMKTQLLLAHLPLLLHPSPQHALVIGLGAGITLGAVTRHPLKSIECLEVSPEVVEAAGYFKEQNHDALADPRVRLIVEDARTHIAFSENRYDVISSEPSNLWMKGVSSLFTQEFFRLCRRRLNQGGILCQWLHYYKTPHEDFKALIHTFSSVFPHVQLWETLGAGDYLLIGSDRPIFLDLASLTNRTAGVIQKDMEEAGVREITDLLSHFFMGDKALRRYVQETPINTDDNALLEFSSPKGLYQPPQAAPLEEFILFREPAVTLLDSSEDPEFRERLEKNFSAKKLFLEAKADFLREEKEQAMKGLEKSLSLYPEDMEVRLLLGRLYLSRSQRARSRRGFSEAVSNLEKFLDIYPQDLPSRLELAALYHQQKKGEKALEHYKFAFKQKPHRWDICLKIAALLDERGLLIEAESFFRQAVRIDTTSALPHLGLGMFYLKRGHPGKAREALKQALQQDPSNAYARQLLRETEE